MLPNKNHQRTGNSERSTKQFDQVLERLSSVKQLSIADQRTAAINMGKLAVLVNPKKPYDGAMKIIDASKLSGVKNKRKRFFRLPGEDAPLPSGSGTYNANPNHFLSLARAAGRLISNSNEPALQQKSEEDALRALLLGTSHIPSYVPQSLAERSVKGLLEDYALRLAEAIETRTRLVELWEALEVTPIEVISQSDEDKPSEYGAAAVVPLELRSMMFWSDVKSAVFKPDPYPEYEFRGSWSQPSIELGHLMATYGLYALKIPKDKEHLFPPVTEDSWIEFVECASERNAWLESIGFDVGEHHFTDGEVGREQVRLDRVTVAFLHKISLGIRKGVANKVELEIRVQPTTKHVACPEDFFVAANAQSRVVFESIFADYVSNSESGSPISLIPISPAILESDDFDALLDERPEIYSLNSYMLDDVRNNGSKILILSDGLDEPYWVDEDDFADYRALKRYSGWIEDTVGATLLLGANNLSFIPSVIDAEPEAGAARAGSIAASLLKNAEAASAENKISQLLIDHAALTAEAGLNFYNALLEKSRSAISQI
jgi:hypothetical protein